MIKIQDLLYIKNLDDSIDEICKFIKNEVIEKLQKRGCVIGLSGGIDSTVAATLCSRAVGSENTIGVIMPEKESDLASEIDANEFAKSINLDTKRINITNILESFEVYSKKEKIVKKKFPKFNEKCKYRMVSPPKLMNSIGIPYLEILDENNMIQKLKISPSEFLTITAATSIKHRVRMTMLYYFAEKNNYCVIGTTNKSEYLQGYFVKYGDGGSDIEPLVNIYKTQIYQIGKFLQIPNRILTKDASPDVWSFTTSDEEFFYSIPYDLVDLILYAIEKNIPEEEIQKISNLTPEQISILIKIHFQKFTRSKHMREVPHAWIPNFNI